MTSRRMGAARAQRTQGEATVRVVDKTALGRHAGAIRRTHRPLRKEKRARKHRPAIS